MVKISTLRVIKESTYFSFKNLKVLGKLLLIPVLLQIGLVFLLEPFEKANHHFLSFYKVSTFIIDSLILSLWVPKWIQYYFNPKEKVSFFKFQRLQWKFFLYSCIFVAIFFVSVLPLSLLEYSQFLHREKFFRIVPVIVFWGVNIILLARFSFVEPAISLSHPTGLKQSWKETSSQVGNLVRLVIFFQGIFSIFFVFPLLIIFGLRESLQGVLCTPVTAIFYIATSKFYQRHLKA
ncbi:MAG: hypothetical protein A2621_01645 [Alphaproteobacteria bacterium RIFCSPHIGHO2_01_FULL_41_14]|nr:MAG: hypothetical protein A2065_01700 [Alphaproteobacteria bacterium GWB1_45_5]OFW89600.1 MAG: hypothetical protein A2621_01645 [Alphaproteobacteria bacterium RIFCSPHIGHO2_01_FULL_41_14]HCI48488.1 hypothetical protein [Holosporales bacterium]